jgi:predicted Zn-dependent peptidase
VGSYRRSAAEIAAVTPETVARVARRLLDPRFEIVAVVRPPALPTVAKIAPAKAAPKTGASPAGARRQEAP